MCVRGNTFTPWDLDPQFIFIWDQTTGELECNLLTRKNVTPAAILIAPLLSTSVRLNGGTAGVTNGRKSLHKYKYRVYIKPAQIRNS